MGAAAAACAGAGGASEGPLLKTGLGVKSVPCSSMKLRASRISFASWSSNEARKSSSLLVVVEVTVVAVVVATAPESCSFTGAIVLPLIFGCFPPRFRSVSFRFQSRIACPCFLSFKRESSRTGYSLN